jgi:hypothetical protein
MTVVNSLGSSSGLLTPAFALAKPTPAGTHEMPHETDYYLQVVTSFALARLTMTKMNRFCGK